MIEITNQIGLLFGIADKLPLRGFPDGRIKIRIRTDSFVQAFIKTADGIEVYSVKEKDGYWEPCMKMGANYRS